MHRKRWLPLALSIALSTACYHQIVTTGQPPGTLVVQHPFLSTWVLGLKAADPIDVRRECPMGVAVIDSKRSFVNGVVSVLTVGIYTPLNVKVTCAASRAGSLPSRFIEQRIPANSSAEESARILDRAVEQATESGTPVVLRF